MSFLRHDLVTRNINRVSGSVPLLSPPLYAKIPPKSQENRRGIEKIRGGL
ncbi:hypothetical protein CGRA01v4_07328 [Colletotrichum graminicola]|nr:hypothetical protein CGRA01v4_07328 [Colletotrichum graminicola]